MSCFCLPGRRNKTFFHWPNFTFSHSQHSINPKRIHSTFSLAHKHKPKRVLRRRHTLHNGTIVADLKKPGRSHKSLKKTKTSPAIIDTNDMNERYSHPPDPPPGYQVYHPNSRSHSGQRHVSWEQAGTRSSELGSNNPFPNAHIYESQELPQSNLETPPEYEPPSNPPPSEEDKKTPFPDEEYPLPHWPPSSYQVNEPEPPPYDPWLAVPDNALLPPPPSFREERSPASNASWDDAAQGHEWCRRNPLWAARRHNQQTLSRISNGDINLTIPPKTRNVRLSRTGVGRSHVRTNSKCTDTVFLSDVPLYAATAGWLPTIYFELRVISINQGGTGGEEADAGISMGFLAPPYPIWRQPGWHRASLAVHGDDGRRFVDDSFAGKDFTSAFNKNDVVGIGMRFWPPRYVEEKNHCEIFFTRNGKEEGGWNLHEEKDQADDGNVFGLEGDHDLLAAVGCFGAVEFEVKFRWTD